MLSSLSPVSSVATLIICQVLGDVGSAVDQGSFQDLLGYHLVFRRYDQEIRHQLQRFVLVAGNAHHGPVWQPGSSQCSVLL